MKTDDDLDHTARRYGTGSFAQNLEIKGMVRDARNKEILEFANVVLQTMDSSL